jgi:hypothetical protein
MAKNYGLGDTTTYYGFCKYDGCCYVSDDYDGEFYAERDILEHLKEDHGDDGD